MRLLAGTSGFSYTEWRGSFYPDKLPEAAMLGAYSERLPTVEINNTFYRMPARPLLEGWAAKVKEPFTFALKAPRRITHIRRLKDVAVDVEHFVTMARVLGSHLGPLLFQLPPTLRRDEALLEEFLGALPQDVRVALEFRHSSWFEDRIYTLLQERGVALSATEVDEDDEGGAPYVRTASFTYVRLRKTSYDARELREVLNRLDAMLVDEAFVYLKHEVLGPTYASTLLSLAEEREASEAGD